MNEQANEGTQGTRRCIACGQPGHGAAACPNAGKPAESLIALRLDEEELDVVRVALCLLVVRANKAINDPDGVAYWSERYAQGKREQKETALRVLRALDADDDRVARLQDEAAAPKRP